MNDNPSAQPAKSFENQEWRRTFVNTILRVACILGIAFLAFAFSTAPLLHRVLFILAYVILLVITLAPIKHEARAYFLLFTTYAAGAGLVFHWGPWLDGSIFFVALIGLSALLFDRRLDVAALILGIFTLTLAASLEQMDVYQTGFDTILTTSLNHWAAYIAKFFLVGIVLITAIRQVKKHFEITLRDTENTFRMLRAERAQLEERVRERNIEIEARASKLSSSASISRMILEAQNVSELMETTTTLTAEQLGYRQVGLYLLDDRKKNAFLQSASSPEGKQVIGQGLRIEPDRLNLIHRVIESNRAYFASEEDHANFVRDANFPFSRSRLTLPLAVRGDVIGLLDIHADKRHAFNAQDAETLQTLADLVAISIDNVRLLEETRNLLHQLEATTSSQTSETWTKFTSRHKPSYQYTPAGVRPLFLSGKKESGDSLQIPLVLHGQNIGRITLKRKGVAATWSNRERILLEKVATQVALAIENSRLVDETQKRALRDQVIANISARVRETLDVDAVLRTAAAELRKVFDLKEAEISVGFLPASAPPAQKDAN